MIFTRPSAQIRFSPFNAPSDLASPARVARFGNHVNVRQAGLLRFPARFRLVFTVCFVSPFAFPRWEGIGRTTPRFSRRVGDVSSSSSSSTARVWPVSSSRYKRRDILATFDTSLAGAWLSQYPPVLCRRPVLPSSLPSSFLPSFLRCFLPSSLLQRLSSRLSSHSRADFFHPARHAKSNQFTCTLQENSES